MKILLSLSDDLRAYKVTSKVNITLSYTINYPSIFSEHVQNSSLQKVLGTATGLHEISLN